MKNKGNKIFLAIVIGALIVGAGIYFGLRDEQKVNLPPDIPLSDFTSECPTEAIVTKVLDGDTVVVEGGYHIRLLSIDTDEKGYLCYGEAKSRLEEMVFNKEVRLEKDETDVDQYDRYLRYIFLPDGQNINIQLVKEGLAIARFYPPDVKYREEITQAEGNAIDNKVGCKWSAPTEITGDKEKK